MKKLIFALLLLPTLLYGEEVGIQGECTEGNCWNGKGCAAYTNSTHYCGQFKKGLPHGKGIFWNLNGTNRHEFRGNFYYGHLHGWITVYDSTGRINYVGYYKIGKLIRKK